MSDRLSQEPNELFRINNDEDAKMFLLEMGLMGKFSNTATSRTQILTYGEHPTHWIVAMFFTGKTVPTDNGHLIYCLPKRDYSTSQFQIFVSSIAAGHDYVEYIKPLSPQSEDN